MTEFHADYSVIVLGWGTVEPIKIIAVVTIGLEDGIQVGHEEDSSS